MLSESKKVALVLSSGGARGMAHIGVIEELLARGYTISSIAGTSIGAVVGGMYALGKLSEFKEWMRSLDKMDVFRLMDFTLSSQGFLKGERVFEEIQHFARDTNIEELPIPFTAVATDMDQNQEIVLHKGSLFNALRASIAVPSIVQPCRIDGHDLVDGGVINPLPIDHVARSDNELVVAVNLNAKVPIMIKPGKERRVQSGNFLSQWKQKWLNESQVSYQTKSRLGYFDMLARSFEITQMRLCSLMIEKCHPDLVVPISRKEASTFDFHRTTELVEVGRKAFNKAYGERFEHVDSSY